VHQVYADDGVLVFGIHQGDSADLLIDFRVQTGVSFPLLRDEGTLTRFAFPSGVGYPYPRDIVVGKDGVIRSIKNSFNVPEMTALIDELIAEPDP